MEFKFKNKQEIIAELAEEATRRNAAIAEITLNQLRVIAVDGTRFVVQNPGVVFRQPWWCNHLNNVNAITGKLIYEGQQQMIDALEKAGWIISQDDCGYTIKG